MEESRGNTFPRLTRSNWSSEYKEAFKDYALMCGEAGEIIITGIANNPVEPRRDATRRVVVAGVDRDVLIYEDNDRGDRKFANDVERYRRIKEGKKQLISKLLSTMDKDVRDALMTSAGYQAFYDAFDILGMWRLTEQVVLGRGAISVYSLVVRLLRYTQEGAYNKFEKEFKEMIIDLRAQGTEAEVLQKIFNALFILAVNQEQFKEKLTAVYGARVWPNYEDLATELHDYAEARDRMSELRKDNNEGKIQANAVKAEEKFRDDKRGGTRDFSDRPPRLCRNCGITGHLGRDCRRLPHACEKCGKEGHMERYCPSNLLKMYKEVPQSELSEWA